MQKHGVDSGFVKIVVVCNGATDDHLSLRKVSEAKRLSNLRENILKKESWHRESFSTWKPVLPCVVFFFS